jgi:segregation and condensation protein A
VNPDDEVAATGDPSDRDGPADRDRDDDVAPVELGRADEGTADPASVAEQPPAAGPAHVAADARAGERADDPRNATPTTVDGVALARLYGEPLFKMPSDLYIPPDALEVFLETFEGPLDLLLYLIRKQNFNIFDIPLADVTRQYLSYVEQIRQHNLELASEYLLMAAMLIEIKSRMLLPPKVTEDGQEAEDPRAELVRRLLEYEQMKLAAANLDAMPVIGRDFLKAQVTIEQSLKPRFPDVDLNDLREAWADILKRAKLHQHHHISREQLSVREHMTKVLRTLQGVRFAEFETLFDVTRGAPVMVVTFIAMLELAKERLLEITQAEAFAPIYVRLAYQSLTTSSDVEPEAEPALE